MSAGPSRSVSGSPQPTAHGNKKEQHERVDTRGLNPVERHKLQLEKMLSNPDKPIHLSSGPREKTLRPPREMMKNVQGSSAGAGSGEFHVYKQNRRREYERLKMMDEKAKEDEEAAAFLARQRERQEAADAKTAKNRAKRFKKRGKPATGADAGARSNATEAEEAGDGKRRKLAVGGKAGVVFKRPGDEGEDDDDEDGDDQKQVEEGRDHREDEGERSDPQRSSRLIVPERGEVEVEAEVEAPRTIEVANIVIHDSD